MTVYTPCILFFFVFSRLMFLQFVLFWLLQIFTATAVKMGPYFLGQAFSTGGSGPKSGLRVHS